MSAPLLIIAYFNVKIKEKAILTLFYQGFPPKKALTISNKTKAPSASNTNFIW